MWELTLASQFRRGWSCHPALLARDTRVACSAVGLGQQLAAQRGPEVPPWWLGRVGGSSSSSKKEVSGIYRHRHTNTLKKQTRHSSCMAGRHRPVKWPKAILPSAPESSSGDVLGIMISISKDKPGILPPIKDLLFKNGLLFFVWLDSFDSPSVLNVRTFGNLTLSLMFLLTRFYQSTWVGEPFLVCRRARDRNSSRGDKGPGVLHSMGYFQAFQSSQQAPQHSHTGVASPLSLLSASLLLVGRVCFHSAGSGWQGDHKGTPCQPLEAPPAGDRALPQAIREHLWGPLLAPPLRIGTGLTFTTGASSTTSQTTINSWIAVLLLYPPSPLTRVLLRLKWNQNSCCRKALQLW